MNKEIERWINRRWKNRFKNYTICQTWFTKDLQESTSATNKTDTKSSPEIWTELALRIKEENLKVFRKEGNWRLPWPCLQIFQSLRAAVHVLSQGEATRLAFFRVELRQTAALSLLGFKQGYMLPKNQEPTYPIWILSARGSRHLPPSQICLTNLSRMDFNPKSHGN